MNEDDNIHGSARGFSAGYATRIVCYLIENNQMANIQNLQKTWEQWSDFMYNWMLQDSLGSMSDKQYEFIQKIMKDKNYTENMVETVKANIRMYNVKQARELIGQMLNDKELPPDYDTWWNNQSEHAFSVFKRADREP